MRQCEEFRKMLITGYILVTTNKMIRDKCRNIDDIINKYLYNPLHEDIIDKWEYLDDFYYGGGFLPDYVESIEYIFEIKRNMTFIMAYSFVNDEEDETKSYKLTGNYKIIDINSIQLLFGYNSDIYKRQMCENMNVSFEEFSSNCVAKLIYIQNKDKTDIHCKVYNPTQNVQWRQFKKGGEFNYH
eukprot:188766_1